MKFRAICTDIDGTLLDSNRQLSARTINAIRALDKNIPVILASSRMPSAMRHLQEELNIVDHPLICFNGGYVLHYNNSSANPKVFDSVFISAEICAGIIAFTKGSQIHSSLYFEDNWYAPTQDQWTEREATITKVSPTILSAENVLNDWTENNIGAHKVMCMGSAEEITQLEKNLINKYSADLNIYRSRSTYLEIAPKIISKGTGLDLLLKQHFDITMKDVIAFGDNYNDIDLLNAVGHGVAVSNARDEVKAVAKEITADSKADGVAMVIEKYFL
jgi:Cof subfamily protein (haloacid dehalogenase superfamily)